MARIEEPNSQVKTLDYSEVIPSAPMPQGLNIAAVVDGDTGPIDRITIHSQKELIDTYTTGNALNQRSNQTLQVLGTLLNYTAIDVIRTDSGKMRVGVGSLGNTYYGDDKYKPLDSVDFIPITDTVNLGYPVLWIVVGQSCYFMGDESLIPSDIEEAHVSLNDIPNIGSITGAIERFIYGLEVMGVSVYDTQRISRFSEEVKRYIGDEHDNSGLPGFYNANISRVNSSKLDVYKTQTGKKASIYKGDCINVDNYVFAFVADETDVVNTGNSIVIPISGTYNANTLTDNTTMPQQEFVTRMLEKIYTGEVGVTIPWGMDNEFTVDTGETKLELHGKFLEELLVNGSLIVSKDANDIIESTGKVLNPKYTEGDNLYVDEASYIRIDNCVFYVGENPTEASTANVYETFDTAVKAYELKRCTGQGALLQIKDFIDINKEKEETNRDTTLASISKYTMNWETSHYPSVVYKRNGTQPSISGVYKAYNSDGIRPFSQDASRTNYYEFRHETTETNSDYAVFRSIFFCIDTTCYYSGVRPVLGNNYTYINLYKNKSSVPNFLSLLYEAIKADYIFGKVDNDDGEYGIRISGCHTYDWSGNPLASRNANGNVDDVVLNVTANGIENTDQLELLDKFIVFGKFLADGMLFNMGYTTNNDLYSTINLALTYKGGDTSTYKISFDPDAMDDFGKSLYYTQVNEGNTASPYFYIAERFPSSNAVNMYLELPKRSFGKELAVLPPSVNDYQEAILKFNNSKYNVDNKHYDYIIDSGYANPIFAVTCSNLAEAMNSIYLPSFPTKVDGKDVYYVDKADYENYRDSVGTDTPRTIWVAPIYKAMTVGKFMSTLPRSVSFLINRIEAFKTTVHEFRAGFGIKKGLVSSGIQPVIFDDDDRTDLLQKQINTIKNTTTKSYMNNNLTGQSANTYLSEAQNIYMTNVICHICDDFNSTIEAEQNTPELWGDVQTDLNSRITERLISEHSEKPAGIKVICNNTTNTQDLIDNNTLKYEVWVMYTPSVKYVLAYVGVKRLGSF